MKDEPRDSKVDCPGEESVRDDCVGAVVSDEVFERRAERGGADDDVHLLLGRQFRRKVVGEICYERGAFDEEDIYVGFMEVKEGFFDC